MMAFVLPLILPICFLDEDSAFRIFSGSFTHFPSSNTARMKEQRIYANARLHAEPIVSR